MVVVLSHVCLGGKVYGIMYGVFSFNYAGETRQWPGWSSFPISNPACLRTPAGTDVWTWTVQTGQSRKRSPPETQQREEKRTPIATS